ncbi:ABC transporter ATP-binding protein [Tabrizicola soli]|jgi:NitT/TauT family transport system ATP-binding protein|uniref:ABC transporter ATP-binding protein n=1 Tax=Tabrizicola soli TaxID=2185115 RepID=A0ABV7DV85_9RHOB|nr:ABC transporter ATP-binding protein [Tabrizicola soli]
MDQARKTISGHCRVDAVGKVFGSADSGPEIVLKNCSFEVPAGSLTVLLGPSGCGKSTLVQLVAGYDTPTLGNVTLDGVSVTGPGTDRIVVFQETALFPWMTLLDNVAYGPIQMGIPRREAESEASALLRDVGLKAFEDRYPSQISGGMQRRAEVARALIARPKLMLLDEPFRGLDHMSRGLMQEYYLKLFDQHQTTTLFVTSEIDEAIFLADRLVILSYKPTTVQTVIDVPLPRPRDFQMLTSSVYGQIKEQALDLLYNEALKAFDQPAIPANGGVRGTA